MIINTYYGQFYYDLFYQIAFVVVILIYLIEGHQRKLPWITWLLVIVTVRLFFIIGTKFGAITAEDFNFLVENHRFPDLHYKNILGGLIFGLIAIGLSKIILQIKYPILDAFAVALPFGMAIQRVGCLVNGCCFGTETNLPIGIRYGTGSPAFLHQFYTNRLGINDNLSLNIHPVPIYIIISCLIIGYVMLKYNRYWKRPGNLALSGLLLLFLSRFIIEFFRDPLSNGNFQGSTFFGLKIVQIICLILILVLAVIIFYREKNWIPKKFFISENYPLHNAFYLFIITCLLFLTYRWFTFIEFNALLFILIPTSFGVIWQLRRYYYSFKVRSSTIGLLLFSLFLMSQTIPQEEKKSYQTIKLGYSGGEYVTYHNIGHGSGCDRVSESQYFKQKYNIAGIGYSISEEKNNQLVDYGLNGYFGEYSEIGISSGIEKKTMIIGLNPYINYNKRWYGFGGGLHLGNLRYTPERWVEEGSAVLPKSGSRKSPILPQMYVSLGPKDIVFVNYKFANHFPSPFPGLYQQIEIGTGFGLKNGMNMRFGTNGYESLFLAGYFPFKNQFVIEPVYQWGNTVDYQIDKSSHFSIGLYYRFGHKNY